MSFTDQEIAAVTQDYFLMKSAQDIYFRDSVLLNKMLKQKTGLYKEVPGSEYSRVPLVYDIAEGGAWGKFDSLKNTDRQMVDAAKFNLKNYDGVAVLNQVSEWENSGPEAMIDLVTVKIQGAQNRVTQDLGKDLYSAASDDAIVLSGLLALCNSSTSTQYGGVATNDIVATDGSKPWAGVVNSTSTVVSLEAIQALRSSAKVGNGDSDKPSMFVTTESLYNKVERLLQVQQRFVSDSEIKALGFTGVQVAGGTLVVDDYCPAGYMFALNMNYIGMAVQSNVNFAKTPWVQSTAPLSRSMHILWRGNLICNHRKAHAVHTALTLS